MDKRKIKKINKRISLFLKLSDNAKIRKIITLRLWKYEFPLGESIVVNGEKEFTHAERFEKILFELYFEDDRSEYSIAFYCKSPDIPQTYLRKGPPIKEFFHANNLKNNNPNYFEKNGYLLFETQREFTNFLDFLKQFIKQKAPENFNVLNISNCTNSKLSSGKKALTILKDMIMPFYL